MRQALTHQGPAQKTDGDHGNMVFNIQAKQHSGFIKWEI